MSKFGTSQPVTRLEDNRFLTGKGRYVDDIMPVGALHGYVLRSTQAHGDITGLDVSAAREAPGVRLVLTAEDITAAGLENAMKFARVKTRGAAPAAPVRPILAEGRVRFVGDPVAFIVADSLPEARDAAELVELDLDERPAKVDVAPGGETIHPEAPDNVAYDFDMGDDAATEAAMAGAAHVVSHTSHDNRIIANSMEPRGCYA